MRSALSLRVRGHAGCGLKDLVVQHEERIRNGIQAYELLGNCAPVCRRAVRDQFNSSEEKISVARPAETLR